MSVRGRQFVDFAGGAIKLDFIVVVERLPTVAGPFAGSAVGDCKKSGKVAQLSMSGILLPGFRFLAVFGEAAFSSAGICPAPARRVEP